MKISRTLLIGAVAVALGCSAAPKYTKDGDSAQGYFDRLKTEKVASDPIVQWRNIGPGMSGYNEELWTHPSNPDVMFVGPDMHVSYGTWDGGKSWWNIKDVDAMGQYMKRVVDMEFSRQDPNFAMALDWNGWVYKSTDQGKNWTKIEELSRSHRAVGQSPHSPVAAVKGWYNEQIGFRLSELAVDPTNDKIWYIGAGDFFNVKKNHRSLKRPKGTPSKYADYGYIFKTSDKGATWKKITTGLPEDLDVAKIIVNPLKNSELIMASNNGLFFSYDAGLSWQKGGSGLPNNNPRDLTSYYNPKNKELVLYLVEQTVYEKQGDSVKSVGGVYTSFDFGKTWQNTTGNLYIDLTKIDFPAEINRYYKTIGNWFGISEKQAEKQYKRLPEAALPVFNRIAVSPRDPKEIYVTYNKKHDKTFGSGELWRTLDGGRTWTTVARNGAYWVKGKDKEYWESRGNPTGTNIQFAHLQAYMDTQSERSGNRLLEINSAGEVFISVDQQTLRSRDKGKTWQQIDDDETAPGSGIWIGRGNSDLPGRFMLLDTGIKDRRLFTCGEHGLWQTVPTPNWPDKQAVGMQQIEGQVHIHGMVSTSTVAVHPKDPNTIYLLSWRQDHMGKLRRTKDGGKTWKNIATVLDTAPQAAKGNVKYSGSRPNMPAQNSLLVDPNKPENLYLAVTRESPLEVNPAQRPKPTVGGFGFMKSSDGGLSWKVNNNGFHEGFSLRRLALDPSKPGTIYGAANDKKGGLYKSTDYGESWQRMPLPAEISSVQNIAVDKTNQTLYMSTGLFYEGAYEAGGAWRSTDGGASWQKIFKAPLVTQVESSPVNPDLLLVTAGNQRRFDLVYRNPGLFLSQDGGKSWKKINTNLGNSDKIVDAKPDPYNENVLWAAGWGSGWFVGYINGNNGEGWFKAQK